MISSPNPTLQTGLSKASCGRQKSGGWSWRTASCGWRWNFRRDNLPLIGQTPAMQHLRQTLRHVANADVDVLIAGETGTGKEVAAEAAA